MFCHYSSRILFLVCVCACSLEDMCDTIRLYHRYNDEQLCDVAALKPNTLVVAKYPASEDEE